MANNGTKGKGFTLLETLAAVAIIAVLLAVMVPQVANFVATAQRESDKRTLTVLNDALNRYKTQGGDLNALTYGAPVGNILQRMGQSISWNGMRHNVMQTGVTYPARSISVRGDKKQYEFIRYNSYVPTGEEGSVNTPTTTPGTNVSNGSVTVERWLGIPGQPIYYLTSNGAYISNIPTETYTISSLQVPSNVTDFYGQRIRGYIYPPYTGNYTFQFSTDDGGEFWLSNSDQASLATLRLATQVNIKSTNLYLTKGKPYYFMILHKEHSGGDSMWLSWQGPNGLNGAISSAYIGDYYGGREASTVTVASVTPGFPVVAEGDSVTLTASINNGVNYQWYRNGIALPSQNSSTLNLNNLSTESNGSQYYCTFANVGETITTSSSTITVYPLLPNISGDVTEEYFGGITGGYVSDLTNSLAYINNNPTATYTRTSLDLPTNVSESFGRRIRGYLTPPFSGVYTFSKSNDDDGAFYLSTDSNPSNKALLASGFNTSTADVTLVAGQRYYFEILHKENTGGDFCTIGWRCGNFRESAISSAFLDRYAP